LPVDSQSTPSVSPVDVILPCDTHDRHHFREAPFSEGIRLNVPIVTPHSAGYAQGIDCR
jgi:hypothetical protein